MATSRRVAVRVIRREVDVEPVTIEMPMIPRQGDYLILPGLEGEFLVRKCVWHLPERMVLLLVDEPKSEAEGGVGDAWTF